MATLSDLLDWLRAVNVPLSLLAFLALGIRVNDRWFELERGEKITRTGLLLALLVGALGAAIKYVLHVPADPSIAVWSVACLLIIGGLWHSRPFRL